jgi:UDP-N-acetyl-D-glucosamine dehydrogenase
MTDPASETLVVMGQGYVGFPLAVRAAEVGYRVTGFEPDARRLGLLRAGASYVEDVPSAQLREALASGRYHPSGDEADLAGFDVAVIAVPTPLRAHAPDLSAVEAATGALARHLRTGATVVLESTTYPGTTEEIVGPLLEAGSGLRAGADFQLGYSSERIDPGNRTWTLVNTPKLVSGIDEASLKTIAEFYATLVERVVPVARPSVAELAKLLENTFRHVNIALVNELAMFANELGIDVGEAIDAASTKPFGFMRFDPGPGVGGHCLPVDPSYLSWRVRETLGRSFRFVELANDVNDHMPEYVKRRLTEALNRRQRSVNGARILLLGLAYKRNSGDYRESPAIALAHRLVALGAEVRAADPHVVEELRLAGVTRVEATRAEIEAADAIVVVTDHDAFDFETVGSCGQFVLDTRRRVHGDNVEHL